MNGHHPLEKIKSSIKNGLIFLSMGKVKFK